MKINKMKQTVTNLNLMLLSTSFSESKLFKYNISHNSHKKNVVIETTESLQLKLKNAKRDRLSKEEIKKTKAKIKEMESKKLYLSNSNKYS
jgi:hypothetical protein